MVLKDLKKGIEYCLSNGKRLYNDAKYLNDDKRYRTAIPIYILAYEEMGKAIYLFGKLEDGVEVKESEFRSMTTMGSHTSKITMDYREVENRLNRMTDLEFEGTKRWAARRGQSWWTVDRRTAIAINRTSIDVLEKLNEVKKAFLYVGYVKGEWYIQTQFSMKMLEYLCKYLAADVLRPYHMLKLDMYLLSLGAILPGRMSPENEEKMLESEHRKNLNDLFRLYQTPSWKKVIQNAYMVIDACHVGFTEEKP